MEKSGCILLACVASSLIACGGPVPVAAEAPPSCGTDGALVGEIYGGVRASIEWYAAGLECEGMPRPGDRGARLRFAGEAGSAPDRQRLALILGLPDLVQGETASELPTNVTVIEEGTGRFFSTRSAASCWTDIRTHERMSPDEPANYRISGVLYCVAPLADLSGNSNISFSDLTFTGRLNWNAP
jgi:hypothetical protein